MSTRPHRHIFAHPLHDVKYKISWENDMTETANFFFFFSILTLTPARQGEEKDERETWVFVQTAFVDRNEIRPYLYK